MKFLSFMAFLCICFVSEAQKVEKFGLGNHKNVTVSSSASSSTATRTLQSTGFLPNHNAASRFLTQATLGATLPEIETIRTTGIEQWLDQQLAMPPSFSLNNYVQQLHQATVDSLRLKNPAGTYNLQNVFVDNWHFDVAWFQGSMTAPDQLRWRVAMALSEIFVVSRRSAFDGNPYALANYYDVLMKNSFTNYRTLIDSVTYHPTMAVYLTYMNNHATDTTGTKKIYPDENYARELMQLFSIGLFKLNTNGTEQRDAEGKPIPTYNNDDIANLSKVFTGLGWGDSKYLGERSKDYWSYTRRLKFYAIDSSDAYKNRWKTNPRIVDGHEPGSKTFLGSTIVARPVAQGEQDIQDALTIIFNHPNVGPFIARRLIQRLITSNPSPEYVTRISAVFANNGNNVRGDMKAVIRAIFLDSEARLCNCFCEDTTEAAFVGKLREPFLRYMNLVKGLNLNASGGIYRNVMNRVFDNMEQKPLYSPSVFNFYQPDYIPDGDLKTASKYAPEFQLLNSQTFTGYVNALHTWLIDNNVVDYYGYFNGETYKAEQRPSFDLTADYVLMKNNRLTEFLDKYNMILANGAVTQHNITFIKNALLRMPLRIESTGEPNTTDAFRRQRIALILLLSSPDYLISK